MAYAFQVVFDTEEQADECASWFYGAGEQDWWGWAENQPGWEVGDEDFICTDVSEYAI